jgi:excisionase family DNA binding protein
MTAKTITQPLGYSINQACAVTSLGRTTIYDLIAKRQLDVIRIGKRTIVKADSVRRLIDGEA